jgi:Glycosyltransferase
MVGHGEIGLLVAPGDASALAEAMAAVWRAPEEARQRAARARREVVKYTWPAVRDKWAASMRSRRRLTESQSPRRRGEFLDARAR